jgi:hypothetical protein
MEIRCHKFVVIWNDRFKIGQLAYGFLDLRGFRIRFLIVK